MTEASKDKANIELMSFLAQYTALLDSQLHGVRQQMAKTIEVLMSGISDINSAAEHKKAMAETVLVKREADDAKVAMQGDDAHFKNARMQDGEVLHPPDNARERFAQHIEKMGIMEGEMRDLLFRMMGTLSSDDVVAQRMDHVRFAIRDLAQGLHQMGLQVPSGFTQQAVGELKHNLLAKMQKNYTMEEEKDVLRSVFGGLTRGR